MTNQQAINQLNLMEMACRTPKSAEAVRIATAAIQKRTPTMVTHEASLHRCCTCPSCKNVVDKFEEFVPGQKIRVRSNWCCFCGQALKWED